MRLILRNERSECLEGWRLARSRLPPSFETPAARAPQDEEVGRALCTAQLCGDPAQQPGSMLIVVQLRGQDGRRRMGRRGLDFVLPDAPEGKTLLHIAAGRAGEGPLLEAGDWHGVVLDGLHEVHILSARKTTHTLLLNSEPQRAAAEGAYAQAHPSRWYMAAPAGAVSWHGRCVGLIAVAASHGSVLPTVAGACAQHQRDLAWLPVTVCIEVNHRAGRHGRDDPGKIGRLL